jgi:hypothetical protein
MFSYSVSGHGQLFLSGYVQLFVSGHVQFLTIAALIHFGIQMENDANGFRVARDLDQAGRVMAIESRFPDEVQ